MGLSMQQGYFFQMQNDQSRQMDIPQKAQATIKAMFECIAYTLMLIELRTVQQYEAIY